MGLEVASYISELVATNPTTSDGVSQGDDHIRLLKTALQTQFPNLGAAAVTPTATELNYVDGVTSAIQTQLDSKITAAAYATGGYGRWVETGAPTDVSGSPTSINITGLSSTFDVYMIELMGLVPAGAGALSLLLRTSTDGGSTYAAGASDYLTTTPSGGGGSGTGIVVCSDARAGGVGVFGQILLYRPSVAQTLPVMGSIVSLGTAAGSFYQVRQFGGIRDSAADVDAVRLLWSDGSAFTAGRVRVYGRAKA